MLFEGIVHRIKFDYEIEKVKNKYDDHLPFENGFFGVKSTQRSGTPVSSYIGGVTSTSKETKTLSNLTAQSFVSFSLQDFLKRSKPDVLGAGAWYCSEEQQLILYRHVFGLVPLYYIQIPGQLIAFSTSLIDLLRNEKLTKVLDVNLKRVSAYGSLFSDSSSAYEPETFYQHVKSVPPGHLVTLTYENGSSVPIYQYNPSKWSNLRTASEFGEEFRDKFLDSIRRNVAGDTDIIASHLSGGLDSSSISSAIKFLYPQTSLHTLYNISSGIDTDENLFAVDVANKIGSTHHEILQSEDDFGLFKLYIPLFGQPSCTLLSPSFNGSLMQYAKSLGSSSIFNGTAGDSIVGSGLELINRSYERRDWQLVKDLLQRRVKYFSHAHQYEHWDTYSEETRYHLVLQNFLFRRLAPQLVQLPFKKFWKLYSDISTNFDISYSYFLKRGGKSLLDRFRKGQIVTESSILVDDLCQPLQPQPSGAIMSLLLDDSSTEHRQSLLDVYSAQDLLAHEQDFVLSNHYQIVNKSPFYSHDLFELCMAVPDLVKYGDGIGRAHFREAMKGILPETVRSRSTKAQIRSLGQKIALRLYSQSKDFLEDSTEIWHYVDKGKFNRQVNILQNERIPYDQKVTTWVHISRTVSLAVWLEWLKTVQP
jgi:asparagine synthase (glutamine-hydrolysing)